MKNNNKSGYSIILATLMVGFILVLISGVFLLVLGENKDTKAMEYYLKAFAGAEGSVEIALLKAKNYSYSYSEKINDTNSISKIFSGNQPNSNKDVIISYELDSTGTGITNKIIESGKFDIIPLFHYNESGNKKKVTDISIELSKANDTDTINKNDVVWNIVGENSGISGTGAFDNSTEGNLKEYNGNITFSKKNIGEFLSDNNNNYLILHNTNSNSVKYNLKSNIPEEFLTKETSIIIGKGEIGGFKQNLSVKINNAEYLNLLKYSIFSD